MTQTAIFLGGPLDGQLRAVQNPFRHISAAQLDPDPALFAREPSVNDALAVKRVIYETHRVSFFGANLLAFTPTNLSEADLREAAIRHLLAPNARAALV